jgi:hypothetical protein
MRTSPSSSIIPHQQELEEEERQTLIRIRNRKLRFVIPTYIGFVVAIILGWWLRSQGWRPGRVNDFDDEEEMTRLAIVAPYFIAFLFILVTIYFIRYYVRSALPFIRDIKLGKKNVLVTRAEKYKTPYAQAYYLKIPFGKRNNMTRIHRQLYDAIGEESQVSIAYAPSSQFILSIKCENQLLTFNEKNSIIER